MKNIELRRQVRPEWVCRSGFNCVTPKKWHSVTQHFNYLCLCYCTCVCVCVQPCLQRCQTCLSRWDDCHLSSFQISPSSTSSGTVHTRFQQHTFQHISVCLTQRYLLLTLHYSTVNISSLSFVQIYSFPATYFHASSRCVLSPRVRVLAFSATIRVLCRVHSLF